ncbi:MAG: scyllo-inosose 3-dehydrogenase [Thermodesulfobacteriota bacterium]
MKALFATAEWSPKEGYPACPSEQSLRRANIGSQVWKRPVFEIKETPTPDIGDDELLIRVKRCGVCGSDTHLYETDEDGYIIYSGPVKLPCVIGHEYSGVVEKAGSKVKSFKPGDLVSAESVIWCGVCTPCRSGAVNQCARVELAGITAPGAFAEFIAANERHCWSINGLKEAYDEEGVFDAGALIEPAGCAYNGLFIGGGGFMPGSVAAVFGAGPIGLSAVALARAAGASKIIAFDLIETRLELARKMGADFAYNISSLPGDGSPSEVIRELTGGRGAEVIVEAAGAAKYTLPEMERSLAVNGQIIYLGRAATSASMYMDILVSGANQVVGVRGHAGYGIYNNLIRLMRSGRLDLTGMITAHYDFKDVMSAIKKSSDRTDGKIIVDMD